MECKYIIDRIEEDFAVCECEDGSFTNIPLSEIGFDIKDGQTLIKNNGVYTVKKSDSGEARALFDKLFKKGR